MADSKRKTANLFDKDNADTYQAYFPTTNYWMSTDSDSISVKIPCEANTQYTLSIPINDSGNIFRIYEGDDINVVPAYINPPMLTRIIRAETTKTYTFTTSATAECIVFQGAYAQRNVWLNGLMLNEGSTALPYEPYGWLHSLRKLGTGTDSITTFPTTIYTDGQTIGVNLLNTTDTQQTFPAGTYYIYSDTSDANIEYYDNVGEHPTIYGVAGMGNVFTATTSLVVQASSSSLPKGMVAKSSTAVPFQPYSNCTIIGNMSQTGTPTPSSPIQPSECGDRTGNLLNYKYLFSADYERQSAYFSYYKLVLEPTTQYTLTTNAPVEDGVVTFFFGTTDIMSTVNDGVGYNVPKTITSNADGSVYIARRHIAGSEPISIVTQSDFDNGTYYIMLNTGSQPLPYQPYGYKLDIKSANTTTPVYLGEVESTRQIKKLVFDGTESWEDVSIPSQDTYRYRVNISDTAKDGSVVTAISSHYSYYYGSVGVGFNIGSGGGQLYIRDANCATAADFKTYLQQQYAAGTPVCVWYVLATPQTAVVNEPIRKIGDYADSVSGISIPTITGADSFDVQTTLKPSEVELTYTGWHDATVKEWDGSEWQ